MLIERYLQSEIAKPFVAGFGMLSTVFIAFSAAVKLSEAAAGEIASVAVLQLIFLNTLIALEVLVPTTLYLAVLYAIGRLYRDSEMAALAAAGQTQKHAKLHGDRSGFSTYKKQYQACKKALLLRLNRKQV